MLTFSTVWPALGATGALLTLLLGYRMMRGQPSEYLDAADLILLREERRREAAGRLSLLERFAGRFVPRLRRMIGPGGVSYLQRLINYAGRPIGVTVDGLLRKMVWWAILLLPAVVVFVVGGFPAAALLVPVVAIFLPLGRIAGPGPSAAGEHRSGPAGLSRHPRRHGERRHRVPGRHGPGDRPVRRGHHQ